MKTCIFTVEAERDEDGRWGAEVPSLPGCATQGHTRDEAVEALKEMTQAYLEVLIEHDDPLPQETEQEVIVNSGPEIVSVTI